MTTHTYCTCDLCQRTLSGAIASQADRKVFALDGADSHLGARGVDWTFQHMCFACQESLVDALWAWRKEREKGERR